MRFTGTDLELLDGSVGQLDVRVNIRHCLPNVGLPLGGKVSVTGPRRVDRITNVRIQSCQDFSVSLILFPGVRKGAAALLRRCGRSTGEASSLTNDVTRSCCEQ